MCDREERLGSKSVDDIKKHPFFKGIDWANIRNSTPSSAPRRRTVAPGLTRSLAPHRSSCCATATPPNVPTIGNLEDATNFEEVENEEPAATPVKTTSSKAPTGFQGEELPFIGYSYTHALYNHVLVAQPRSGAAAGVAAVSGAAVVGAASEAAATESVRIVGRAAGRPGRRGGPS